MTKRKRSRKSTANSAGKARTPFEQYWQRSAGNIAGDAIAMRAYWQRQFGDWEIFEVPSDLATLAKQAAEVWTSLADEFEKRSKTSR